MALISDYALQIGQRWHISNGGILKLSARRWLCHQGRWGSILDPAPCGNFALAAEI